MSKLNPPDEWALCANDEPVCPYCGAEMGDAWELSDSGNVDCGDCFRPFFFEREVVARYSTSPLMGPHRLSAIEQQWDAEAFPVEPQ